MRVNSRKSSIKNEIVHLPDLLEVNMLYLARGKTTSKHKDLVLLTINYIYRRYEYKSHVYVCYSFYYYFEKHVRFVAI